MSLLDHEQLLQQQLYFLNLPGKTLSHFYIHECSQNFFCQPPQLIQQQIYHKYQLKNIKTARNQKNSSLYMLTYLFLKIFIQKQPSVSLLQQFKSIFYFSNFHSETITKLTSKNLTNNIIKKIVVEFLQVINYHKDSLEFMLCKYSIILQIFILFFKLILKGLGVQNAMSQGVVMKNQKTLHLILNYFKVPYQTRNGLITFHNLGICILVDKQNNECVIGERSFISEHSEKLENMINQFAHQEDFNTRILNGVVARALGPVYKGIEIKNQENQVTPTDSPFAQQQKFKQRTSITIHKKTLQNPETVHHTIRQSKNVEFTCRSNNLRIQSDVINVQLNSTHHSPIVYHKIQFRKHQRKNYKFIQQKAEKDIQRFLEIRKNMSPIFNGNKSFRLSGLKLKQVEHHKIDDMSRNENCTQRKKIPSFLILRHKSERQQQINCNLAAQKITWKNKYQTRNQNSIFAFKSRFIITEPPSPICENKQDWTNTNRFYSAFQFKHNSYDSIKFNKNS